METRLTTVFGWWDWDAETPALVNRVTGERVAFRGKFEDSSLVAANETWLRFDYLHPDLNFPLLVREYESDKRGDKGKIVWRVDYRRSNELRHRQTASASAQPSFGVWRRVDDCVTDAFAVWPVENTARGTFARAFEMTGGWLNGSWCETFSRLERRISSRDRSPPQYRYDSWLMSLDAAPPSPFVFHDHIPRRNGSENWEVENPVLLNGLSFDVLALRLRPSLPAGKPLTGLEGLTAYLLSADKTRLLYPYYGDTEKDQGRGHWSPCISLIYADEVSLAAAALRSTNGDRRAFKADWHASLLGENFGLREASAGSPYHLRPHPDAPPQTGMVVPSRPLCLRARWAIMDGWSHWKGSRAHSSAWLQGLELFGTESMMLSAGYLGGKWETAARVTVSPSSN
jgi:hypothetical protein